MARVVIFNDNLGRIAEQYLRKGSTCYIEGQLQTRKWTTSKAQKNTPLKWSYNAIVVS